MKPEGIAAIRSAQLGATQSEMAQLLGIDRTTEWKWEHGYTTPTPYQQEIIEKLSRITLRAGELKRRLINAGSVATLSMLLSQSKLQRRQKGKKSA